MSFYGEILIWRKKLGDNKIVWFWKFKYLYKNHSNLLELFFIGECTNVYTKIVVPENYMTFFFFYNRYTFVYTSEHSVCVRWDVLFSWLAYVMFSCARGLLQEARAAYYTRYQISNDGMGWADVGVADLNGPRHWTGDEVDTAVLEVGLVHG